MFTHIISTTIIAAVIAFTPVLAAEKDSNHATSGETHAQTACPLTGKDLKKSVYSDHDGQRVYFCCADCKAAFDKDPVKYMKKLKADGVMLEKVAQKQSLCPVMGGEINTSLYSDFEGKRVYFCCPMCKPDFEKNPARYIQDMETRGIQLAKTPKG